MQHDAISGAELTHFEECACHALADAHGAIQMLARRLGEKGILSPSEVEDLRALTEYDLRSIHAVEDRPTAAHSTNSEDCDFKAVIIADSRLRFDVPDYRDSVVRFPGGGR